MIDLEKARLAFEEYLEQFCREDEKIKLKIVHTKGVVRCAAKICDGMGLSREDCDLAQLIALLHDIGRFEQVRRFDSFEPSVMNHAAYGTELLFGSRQMIRRFVKENTWDEMICQAIGRHSDYSVGEGLSSRELLHACLIRDADKLDNCRVKLDDSIEVMLGCSAGEAGSQYISPEVWEECKSRKSVHLEKRKTKMDYWVSYIAYFFDINYPASAQIIQKERYVERIIGRIPYRNQETKERMQKLGEWAEEYLQKLAGGL